MNVREIVEECEDYLKKVSYFDEKGIKRFVVTNNLPVLIEDFPKIQFTVVPGLPELAHLLYTLNECPIGIMTIDVSKTVDEFINRFPDLITSKVRTRDMIKSYLDGKSVLNMCINDYIENY